MNEITIKDAGAIGRTLSKPHCRFDSKSGDFLIDGEIQITGKDGVRGVLLCSETAITTAVWGEDDDGKPVLELDEPAKFLRDGAEFPYPLAEEKSPYAETLFVIEGVGITKLSGTSWASWNAIRRACSAYWGNACVAVALCWLDIAPSTRSKHKNFTLMFRPVEWFPVERFAHFAPGAAALKAAFAPPPSTPKLTASEIIGGDSIPDHAA